MSWFHIIHKIAITIASVFIAGPLTFSAERTVRLNTIPGMSWIAEDPSSTIHRDTGPDLFSHQRDQTHTYTLKPGTTYKMPIEVMGLGPVVRTLTFDVGSRTDVDRVRLLIHRPAYGYSSSRSADAKVSVRLNGSGWVPILDDNPQIEIEENAQAYGGLAGGFHTMWITVSDLPFQSGLNTLRLRFNGTDGITSGFRLLEMTPAAGSEIISDSLFTVEDDPSLWTSPLQSNTAIAEGERLWHEQRSLTEGPSGPAIIAACADCHAQDGTDLEYYSYSNNSILIRARHHGMSTTEGNQIASYIRSLNSGRHGRPWQPPYQPGPGTDARPAEQWAAGAGLESVLNRDEDMEEFLFPEGTGRSALRRVIDASGTLNIREIPIAMQFPDWNEWLPQRHPEDIWPTHWQAGLANTRYLEVLDLLTTRDLDEILEDGRILGYLGRLEFGSRFFIDDEGADVTHVTGGDHWRANGGEIMDAVTGISQEQARLQLAKWLAVKTWEVMHHYELEDRATDIPDIPSGEIRAWPMRTQAVHAIAPHITSDSLEYFSGQSSVTGLYFSSAWYQLQMTLNAGMRQPADVLPLDWPYQIEHIQKLSLESGLSHPYRFWATIIKMYQSRNNNVGPTRKGWVMRDVHPWRLLYGHNDEDDDMFVAIDTARPSLRPRVLSVLLEAWLSVTTTITFDDWTRMPLDGTGRQDDWFAIEHPDYQPTDEPYNRFWQFASLDYNHADNFYRLIPRLRNLGVDAAVLDELLDWCEYVWPGAEDTWRSLRTDAAG